MSAQTISLQAGASLARRQLAVVAVAGLTVGVTVPGWAMAHLVGLVGFALVATDVLSRGQPL